MTFPANGRMKLFKEIFSDKCGMNPDKKGKSLPIIYWTSKTRREPIGVRFLVASKKCSTKLISSAISKTFKLTFHKIQSFYDKSHFCSSLK